MEPTDGGNIMQKGINFKENKNAQKDSLVDVAKVSGKIVNNHQRFLTKQGSIIPAEQVTQKMSSVMRPSLGIFGSLSSGIIIKNPDIAQNLNLLAQSTFRTISLARPDKGFVIQVLLKAEGFHYH